MKILIFLTKWKGGVGVVVNSIKKELESKGNQVICISREEDLGYFSSIKNLFSLRIKYKKIIQKENPDIIYTQDWSMALPLILPYPQYRKKHFCCFHGNQLGKAKYIQIILGKVLGKRLIVVGDFLKKRFPKANLVYNGVDLNKFKPLKRKREYLGWINKDTELLTREDIMKISKILKLKPLIAENFEIPFERMNEDFYNKCKVFVSFPPITAGFNLCWIEAMASGVPILIGNNEGIGKSFQMDKFSTKEELFNGLNNLLERKYRDQIMRKGLSWEAHSEKLLGVWRK